MQNEVNYEWCIETYTDDAEKDVIEVDFCDKIHSDYLDYPVPEGHLSRLCLVRNEGNEVDGLDNRYWAYVKDGKLPDTFEDGAGYPISIKVPQRYHKELKTYLSKNEKRSKHTA